MNEIVPREPMFAARGGRTFGEPVTKDPGGTRPEPACAPMPEGEVVAVERATGP